VFACDGKVSLQLAELRVAQAQATAIDEELMGPLGFSLDQLMELAGLSCACAIAEVYAPPSFARVLVLAGAARRPWTFVASAPPCSRHAQARATTAATGWWRRGTCITLATRRRSATRSARTSACC
jgi:hypothetical protein